MTQRACSSKCPLSMRAHVIAWAFLCLLWTTVSAAEIRVAHVTSTSVYLDAGRADGLEVGDRLRVVDRAGETVAELEIAFVAEHSASCRLLEGSSLPGSGLEAIPYVLRSPSRPGIEEVLRSPLPSEVGERSASGPTEARLVRRASSPWVRPSGYISLGLQQFSNQAEFGSDLREGTLRLSLRLRELGRLPLEMRIRMRSRESRRGDRAAERRDRLYEASLGWSPPEGRFALLGGRIGASPFRGIGALDGILAAYRPLSWLSMGTFFGSRTDVRDLGFSSKGTKYGTYLQASHRTSSGALAEVALAGVGEYDRDGLVSREYVTLETRLGGGSRWSIFQLAELELSRQWADSTTAQASQLSLFSLSGSLRFSEHFRTTISYDQRQAYREAETRNLSEAIFDDLVRQGLRIALQFGNPRGWTGSVSFGQRKRDGDDPVSSVSISTWVHGLGGRTLSIGLDASAYSGGATEGVIATMRSRKTWRSGHEISLALGSSSFTLPGLGIDRANYWGRLEGTFELPASIYLRGGVELNVGDDLEGQRYRLELGYRL